jgi:glycosyltransferase involved in cell wall biosynthesis
VTADAPAGGAPVSGAAAPRPDEPARRVDAALRDGPPVVAPGVAAPAIPGWAGARVLMLAPTPTWPLDQGNRRRIHAIGQAIRAAGAELHLAHYPAEHDWRGTADARAHAAMAAQWDGAFVIPPSRPLHPPPAAGADHAIDEWWDPAIGAFLDWFTARHRTDALIVHYPFLSRALLHAPPGCLRVLDMHDRFAGRRQVLAAAGIAPEFFHTTEDQEAIALGRADVVLAIKRQEAAAFRAAAPTPVLVLPHAEPDHDAPAAPGRGVLRFGLLGARNSVNLAATEAFLAALHARLRRTLLPCEILLAGSVCDDIPAENLPRYVRRLGRVGDVAAFYAEADVVLAPLAVSTGLKIRVGEALAFGRPVLALAHASEGYPTQHPFHALPDLPALLDAMAALVAEPARLGPLAEASRQVAAEVREQARAALGALGARLAAPPRGILFPLPPAPPDWLLDHVVDAAGALGQPALILPEGAAPPGLAARLPHWAMLVEPPDWPGGSGDSAPGSQTPAAGARHAEAARPGEPPAAEAGRPDPTPHAPDAGRAPRQATAPTPGAGPADPTPPDPALPGAAPAPGAGLRRTGTLASLLAARPLAVWFAAPVPLPEGRVATRAILAADAAAALATPAEVARFRGLLAERFAEVILVAHDPLPGALRVPAFASPPGRAPRRDDAIWLLADAPDCPLAALAEAICTRTAPGRPLRRVMPGAPAALPPGLAVDAARDGPAHALLRETLARQAVPVLRFGRGGARRLGQAPEGPVADALRLADILSGAAPPPPPGPTDAAAGWAALRRLLAEPRQ